MSYRPLSLKTAYRQENFAWSDRFATFASRSARGNFLIESIVAITIGSFFAAALVSGIGDSSRLSSGSQNQFLAGVIAQEIMDAARHTEWHRLVTMSGASWNATAATGSGDSTRTHTLTLNESMATAFNPNSPFPRALLLQDPTRFKYSEQIRNSEFPLESHLLPNGQVTEQLTYTKTDETIRILITVTWQDSEGSHTFRSSTLCSQFGINASL